MTQKKGSKELKWLVILYQIQPYTDQPKKKALFSRFAVEHPLREKYFFAEKNKSHLFRQGFSLRKFAQKLRVISRRNSAKFGDG